MKTYHPSAFSSSLTYIGHLQRMSKKTLRQSMHIRDMAELVKYRQQIPLLEDLERACSLLDQQIDTIFSGLNEVTRDSIPTINRPQKSAPSPLSEARSSYHSLRLTHIDTTNIVRRKREELEHMHEGRWPAFKHWLIRKLGGI